MFMYFSQVVTRKAGNFVCCTNFAGDFSVFSGLTERPPVLATPHWPVKILIDVYNNLNFKYKKTTLQEIWPLKLFESEYGYGCLVLPNVTDGF